MLLTFVAYEELLGTRRVIDLLGEPSGIEDVDLSVLMSRDLARSASFD